MAVLLLSSGGARGFAHVGVLDALESLGVEIDMVLGGSMGAVIGAFYAADISPDEMEGLTEEFSYLDILDVGFSSEGIVKGERMKQYFIDHIGDIRFEEVDKELIINSVDVRTGEEVIFSEGSVIEALRSTVSIPGLIEPNRRGDRLLIDPGLSFPVPFSSVPSGSDVIFVDVLRSFDEIGSHPGFHQLVFQTIQLGAQSNIDRDLDRYRRENPTSEIIHLRPELNRNFLDVRDIDSVVEEGRRCVQRKRDEIERLA